MPEKPESFFADMPDEQADVEKDIKEDASDRPLSKDDEAVRNLEKAKKHEDARLAKLKAELAAKRQEVKKVKEALSKGDDEIEEEIEEEEPVKPAEVDVRATVEATLREREEKQRQDSLQAKIRQVAKTRQEAEKMYEEASMLPKHWDLDEVVKVSSDRVQAIKEKNRGFVMPSFSGGGFADMNSRTIDNNEVEGMTKERVQVLLNSGMTIDQIRRFKDGPDLRHVWGKVD